MQLTGIRCQRFTDQDRADRGSRWPLGRHLPKACQQKPRQFLYLEQVVVLRCLVQPNHPNLILRYILCWRRLVVLLNIPAHVAIVLCYLWIGLNETAAITAVALNKTAMDAVSIREGVQALDPKLG